MTWFMIILALIFLIMTRTFIAITAFILDALALFALFVVVALSTALVYAAAVHHGEFAGAVTTGLTGCN